MAWLAELSHQSSIARESVFASSLLSQLRDRKWELDELASEYCRRNPDAVAKQQNISADEFKAAKV